MKTLNAFKIIAVLAFAALVAPASAVAATGMPSFDLSGIHYLGQTRAVLLMSFNSQSAVYGTTDAPKVGINYTNMTTGESKTTSMNRQLMGSRSLRASVYDLQPNTTYTYRAIMNYNGMNYVSVDRSFFTGSAPTQTTANTSTSTSTSGGFVPSNGPAATPVTATSGTVTTTNTVTTTGNQVAGASITSTTKTGSSSSILGKATASAKNAILTGGSAHKNGVALLITNEEARVREGDVLTYTVKYQNLRTTALRNAELTIELPNQYEFVKSSADLDYDEDDNILTLDIGRVSAETTKSFTFTARAIGDGKGEVGTVAQLDYEGGSITATDRDAYDTGSQSVLGASVFGAGFFPQTLVGWVLVILIILALVIVARRYMTAPVVAKA